APGAVGGGAPGSGAGVHGDDDHDDHDGTRFVQSFQPTIVRVGTTPLPVVAYRRPALGYGLPQPVGGGRGSHGQLHGSLGGRVRGGWQQCPGRDGSAPGHGEPTGRHFHLGGGGADGG